jgi:hypothetical protein
MLDLTFASSSLTLSGLNTRVAADLDATSNHYPLLTIFPWGPRHHKAKQSLKLGTLDYTHFLTLLAANLVGIKDTIKIKDELDYLVDGIISAIHRTYMASATRSLPQGGGQPWWNIEYKNALQDYQSELSSRTDFRRVVRRAQQQYWRKKINAITTSKEVFDMSKWHKTAGSYHTPLIKDPQYLNNPPAVAL